MYEEMVAKNFPSLKKNVSGNREIHQTPSKINTKKTTPSHVIIKLIKVSDKKYLKDQYIKRYNTYKGTI